MHLRFPMIKQASHLFWDMVRNHVGDGRWEMEDRAPKKGSVSPSPLSTPDLRSSSQSLPPQLPTSHSQLQRLPLGLRIAATALSALLFFSGTPSSLAITMSGIKAGSATPGAGGQGSFANLQNAGAASAALTAAMAQGNLKKANDIVMAMKQAQSTARLAATGKLPDGSSIPNGLRVGGLETYNPSGSVSSGNVPITWSGVSSLAETRSGASDSAAATVNITQSQQNAYLYWNKFNVGPQTKLNFDQSKGGQDVGNWIAFNKVMTASDPSHIFGNINAQGQVYILNQNGILFHNGSTVNTHALVASTLPINRNLTGDALTGITGRGIANNPDYQFLFSALKVSSGNNGPTDEFMPEPPPSGKIGNVIVEQGASISSPVDSSHTGGRVVLVGPYVVNNGTISTPNGQTILASGLQVALVPHASGDPSLRGMDAVIGQMSGSLGGAPVATVASPDLIGSVENNGIIEVFQGDVTMAGKNVRIGPMGVIDSSTSVSFNGRIDLNACYDALKNPSYAPGNGRPPYLYEKTGDVVLGEGSAVRILPEWRSDATINGTQLALNSVISIRGLNVIMGDRSVMIAPGAIGTQYVDSDGTVTHALSQFGSSLLSGITVDAGSWLLNLRSNLLEGADYNGNAPYPTDSTFHYANGSISVGRMAVIDAAGSTDVQVSSAQNFLGLGPDPSNLIQLRGSELADSPLQRSSAIRGKNMVVDIRNTGTYNGQYWVGTPLGDVTGYVGLIQKSIGQLTAAGGTVSLQAGNSVALDSESSINVSGGWMSYSGGSFATTKLRLSNGKIVNISQATPDQVYTAIITGMPPVYESPYYSGGAGGGLSITAPSISLSGELNGITVNGSRQTHSTPTKSMLPASASLAMNFSGDALFMGSLATVSKNALSFVIPEELVSRSGFGHITVLNHDGNISLPSGSILNLGANGSIKLEAASIDMEGAITAPGGSVSLKADLLPYAVINALSMDFLHNQSILDVLVIRQTGEVVAQYGPSKDGWTEVVKSDGSHAVIPTGSLDSYGGGRLLLGSGAMISTAGTLNNGMIASSQSKDGPIALDGGQITLSGYRTILAAGSALDVSGGALLQGRGTVNYGNGGTISISGGKEKTVHEGMLDFSRASLAGYSGKGARPGTLSVNAPAIQIGGSAPLSVTRLDPLFFNKGGFGTFNLSGVGLAIPGYDSEFLPGITVAEGMVVQPVVWSQIASYSRGIMTLTPYLLPDPYRPVSSVSLNATGLSDPKLISASTILIRGDLLFSRNASMILDPQLVVSGGVPSTLSGSLSLSASGGTVAVLGKISVPGGKISITGTSSYPSGDPLTAPEITVDISPNARISAGGRALYGVDPLGTMGPFGTVVPGGSISVIGNLLGERGAVLDVSGTHGLYDLPRYVTVNGRLSPLLNCEIDSQGGSITLMGGEMLYSDMTLKAESGGPSAPGGSLVIQSGRFYAADDATSQFNKINFNLSVASDGTSIPVSFVKSGESALGQMIAPTGGIPNGGGHVTVPSIASGGFDSVTLGGNVLFTGRSSIFVPGSITLASGGNLSSDSALSIDASYVRLGMPFVQPLGPDDPARTSIFDPESHSIYAVPSWGSGQLSVHAKLIDLGNLSLRKIGNVTLDASEGSIRGDGNFVMSGALTMNAGQIYPSSGTDFTIVDFNHNPDGTSVPGTGGTLKGTINIANPDKVRLSLPLSACGSLALYADTINQGGILEAPFGSITLGWNGDGPPRVDALSGQRAPVAVGAIALKDGSVTSVSGLDPFTAAPLSVPYGSTKDGSSWIDPSGSTIGTGGLPGKSVSISGANIITEAGSLLDLRGGGDITVNKWVSGTGGRVNFASDPGANVGKIYAGDLVAGPNGTFWSARQGSAGQPLAVGTYWSMIPQYFSIVPGYSQDYTPTGYSDGSLAVGSKIHLLSGAGIAEGDYTLLPSRYATQPGAYLITSAGAAPFGGSIPQTDGSVIVGGTLFNTLNSTLAMPAFTTPFHLISPSQFASMAQYTIISADAFFPATGISTRPADSASLALNGVSQMTVRGSVNGTARASGHGSVVDISSSQDFLIGGTYSAPVASKILLDSALLSSWNVGSLLIGGLRSTDASGTGLTITPATSHIVVDNAGSALFASEVMIASKDELTLNNGSSVIASGNAASAGVAVNGNGAFLRVSEDKNSETIRQGEDGTPLIGLTVGKNVELLGASITLDSSGNAVIDPSATLHGKAINLAAGDIALIFDGSSVANSLNLKEEALSSLSHAEALSLTSYSSIDFHGSGVLGSTSLANLSLHAGEILGDNGGADFIFASSILLDNRNASPGPSSGTPSASGGSLSMAGGLLVIGSGNLSIGGFLDVSAEMAGGVEASGRSGMMVAHNLTMSAPQITATGGTVASIKAGGDLSIRHTETGPSGQIASGAGASLSLEGASVSVSAPIVIPSGILSLTASTGDLNVSSLLDAHGFTSSFYGVMQSADAGSITLNSVGGNVNLGIGARVNLNASAGGGTAGTFSIRAPLGIVAIQDLTSITAKSLKGISGSLILDVGSIGNNDITSIEGILSGIGFTQSQDIRIRNGDLTVGGVMAHSYSLSADKGSIIVTGMIDASGRTGGSIDLFAGKSITLTSGGVLDAHGKSFSNAGKGGAIDLEAGNNPSVAVIDPTASLDEAGRFTTGSVLDLARGLIDLYVGTDASHQLTPGLGQASGTLHLRAPQTGDAKDVQVDPIGATIVGASAISVEGTYRQDAATAGTAVIDNYEAGALNNAASFMLNAQTIASRVQGSYASILQINPGEQIENSQGSLLLSSDWDLSLARYGQQLNVTDLQGNPVDSAFIGRDAGYLTLKAAGNIIFNGSLSDGFGDSINNAAQVAALDGSAYGLYFAPLLPILIDNGGAKYGQKSWSYRITAGGDLNAADPLATARAGVGDVKIGIPTANANGMTADPRVNLTADALAGNYQVIRTGTGDISISSARDIQLLNQFASIYTAGTQVVDPTLGGNFDIPLSMNSLQNQASLGFGGYQQPFIAYPQYSVGGGNVSVQAGGNIAHLQTLTLRYYTDPHTGVKTEIQTPYANDPTLTADSSRQIPVNWLMRRGNIGADGKWVSLTVADQQTLADELTSTTWWVNFANFFEGVGALGGGNVSMTAKGDISNVDASVPTQGRVTARSGGVQSSPANGVLTETGGGDITIKAGGNLDAGVYYVERGNAGIQVAGSIVSNKTRDANGDYLYALNDLQNRSKEANPDSKTFLPTSFLLGRGNISVSANGSALLGPVANVFLLAQGINNDLAYHNYFSTYDLSPSSDLGSTFTAQSLGGGIDFRTKILGNPSFAAWSLSETMGISTTHNEPGAYQPWIRVSADPIRDSILSSILPPNVQLTSFGGDISLQGNVTVVPSAFGGLSLYSSQSIHGIHQQGPVDSPWGSSMINISDASPALVPTVTQPAQDAGQLQSALSESGSFNGLNGVLDVKLNRHGTSLLHQQDVVPIRLYAVLGDFSGITLFSPKKTLISAGNDISDVALYIQNESPGDISIVSAKGNIIPYDPQSKLQSVAQSSISDERLKALLLQSGDIQISGPGTLEILAGGTIDLGNGPTKPYPDFSNDNSIWNGVTSVGNSRNPNLPFGGADLVMAAGTTLPMGFSSPDELALREFVSTVLSSPEGPKYLEELGAAMSYSGNPDPGITRESFDDASTQLTPEKKALMELQIFYIVLRDAGNDFGNQSSPNYMKYTAGENAIKTLFTKSSGKGDILTRERDVKTKNGGDIQMIAPGGKIELASTDNTKKVPEFGIVTEHGGAISLYSQGNVSIGIGRIFTLRGGDIMIWSDKGDIAAGAASKTVAAAPPTRVLIDPQSANLQNDLGGLATGGGIGTLQTVDGVAVANVGLFAPSGVIDAGDAGIRSSGNLHLAATKILNADNIAASGATVGAPPASAPASAPPPAAPAVSAPAGASAAAAAANSAADKTADKKTANQDDATPSVISIDIMGYGGGEGDDSDSQDKKAADTATAPVQASL